ncbi:MAG: NAD(+)/NADH kinase [Oscillospiraceae bacterium]|nr:NAD(+)/NADH kinase [Oscillospiraceae bacterium]
MTAAVFPNFEKNKAQETAVKVCECLHNMGMDIIGDSHYSSRLDMLSFVDFMQVNEAIDASDVVIAIGGDGTILEYSECAAELNKPLLGINTGRLGFMASMETDELHNLSRLISGDYEIENRMMLNAELIHEDGSTEIFSALNDIVVSRPYSKLVDYDVSVNGRSVSSLRADGVVFSTPTGSTAYALSAGGPILEPYLECIQYTPICPQSLSSRTMLFSTEHRLVLKHFSENEDVYFSVDGKKARFMSYKDNLVISKSRKYLRLIDIKGFSFYDAVNNKLMKPIK